MEPTTYLAGFTLCLLVTLFGKGQPFRKLRMRSAFRGLAIVGSAIFMLGMLLVPVRAAILVEYYYSSGPVRPWQIACDVSANRAFFTEQLGNRIGLIEWGAAKFTWWVIPTEGAGAYGISLGPEISTDQGTFVWFTEEAKSKIGRLNPLTGEFIEWQTLTGSAAPRGIFVDRQNKTVWFTEFGVNKIGSLSYFSGGWKMAEYTPPGGLSNPEAIVVDKDGIVWFTQYGGHKIGRFNPKFGEFTQYDTSNGFRAPFGIAVDPDGFIWFTSTGDNKIARLNWWKNETVGWTIPTSGAQPHEIAIDKDYNVWFTEFAGSKIGKFVPGVNGFYEYQTPSPGSQPNGISIVEPGTVAFTETQTNRVGRVYQPTWMAAGGDTTTTTVNWITYPSMTTVQATPTISFTTTVAIANPASSQVFTTSTWTQWSTTSSTCTETQSILYTSSTTTSTTTSTSTTVSTTSTTTTGTLTSTTTESYTSTTTTSTTSTSTTITTSSSTTTVTQATTSYSTTYTMTSLSSVTSTSTNVITVQTTTPVTSISTIVSTVVTTTTSTPSARACVIASAAYGSELAEEAQFLRGFRDSFVQSTLAGSQFMRAFNAFYYSFSPTVANLVSRSTILQSAFRVLLYPLVVSLHISTAMQRMLPLTQELAAVSSGIVAAALTGICYGAPVIIMKQGVLRSLQMHLARRRN